MGALSSVFSVASITMGAYQSYQDAQVRKMEAELAADSLEARAGRKELEADEALRIGELNMAEQRIAGRAKIAGQRVEYAASGVKVNSGTAMEVAADQAAWNEYERQKIEYESGLQSWGLRYDAAMLRNEAANARASGVASASSGSWLQSAGSLTSLFK